MPDRTELRIRWDSMLARTRGKTRDGSGKPRWEGLEVGWASFHEFRDWAYAHGWVPGLTLDRRESDKGYTAGNCQWITKRANDNKARNIHKPACQCFWCRRVHPPPYVDDGVPF